MVQLIVIVAPHVGAWIETPCYRCSSERIHVAPHVGAWIETAYGTGIRTPQEVVAPHVGAWIETTLTRLRDFSKRSHPMWVRGLKHNYEGFFVLQSSVAPHVGAWIETQLREAEKALAASHPMWVRGLKLLTP